MSLTRLVREVGDLCFLPFGKGLLNHDSLAFHPGESMRPVPEGFHLPLGDGVRGSGSSVGGLRGPIRRTFVRYCTSWQAEA